MPIQLAQGQSVCLTTRTKTELTRISLGVGWSSIKPAQGRLASLLGRRRDGERLDLDASAILFDRDRYISDTVWYGQLHSREGSVVHSGDSLTLEGNVDAETININLAKLSPKIESIVLTLSSFHGHTFDRIETAYARVIDADTGLELARFDCSEKGLHTGLILAALTRAEGEWSFRAIGERSNGRTAQDLKTFAANYLKSANGGRGRL